MPIFELDDGRPRLVQPMQPLAGSFAQEVSALLTHHLAAIAGEPLFVVRARGEGSDRADLPELLALDARGRSVVVDVAQVLDDDAIVTALRHGGAASRMTTTDLARAYHADPSRFAVDYAAFREHVPYAAAQVDRRDGVRLVLLCSEVAAEAADSLGFLRGPGRQVDVLQVGVVRGDERRLLEVSALALHEPARRTVEPTALRLVRSSEAGAKAVSYDVDRTRPRTSANAIVEARPTGELKAVAPQRRSVLTGATPIGRRGTTTEPTPLTSRSSERSAGERSSSDRSTAEHHGYERSASRSQPEQNAEPRRTPGPGEAPRPGAPGRPDPAGWTRESQSATPASTYAGPPTLTPIAGLRMAVELGARPADGRPADPRTSSAASWPADPRAERTTGRRADQPRRDPASTDVMAPLDPEDDAPEGPRAYLPDATGGHSEPTRSETRSRTSARAGDDHGRAAGRSADVTSYASPSSDRSSYDAPSPSYDRSSYDTPSLADDRSSYDAPASPYEPTVRRYDDPSSSYEPTGYAMTPSGSSEPTSYDPSAYEVAPYEPTAFASPATAYDHGDRGSSFGQDLYGEVEPYVPTSFETSTPYEPARVEQPSYGGQAGQPAGYDEPGAGQDPGWARPELAMLAKRRRAVTTLVWARERRNQRFLAMLRTDGLIELEDGSVHADPDAAAAVVSGAEGLVDGWRSWRLGEGGPTLAEATGHP